MTRPEVTIGRQDGNVIRLTDRNVSRRHAILYSQNDALTLEDLDSYTGTHLNGERLSGSSQLGLGDVIRIGDYELRVLGEGMEIGETEDSQVTQIDRAFPTGLKGSDFPRPIMDDDDDQDPTAVINMRAGLGAQLSGATFEGLIEGPPARLVVVSAQLAGTEYTIDRSPCKLGRGAECEVRVEHRSISRHHATIEFVDRQYVIKDVGSANPMTVNGETYANALLRPGDRIDLGHIQLRFFPPGQIPEFADLLSLQRRPRGSLATTAALVIGMIALAGITYFIVKGDGSEAPPGTESSATSVEGWRQKMQSQRDGRHWRQALQWLEQAPQEVPAAELSNLRAQLANERKYGEQLEAALAKKEAKNWSEALEDLQAIPKNSVYFEAAERHRAEVRDAFVRLELDLASAALERGRLDKASGHLDSAESYAPGRREVRRVRDRLQAAQEKLLADEKPAARRVVSARRPASKLSKTQSLGKLIKAANQMLIENRAKKALPLFQKALKRAPRNAKIHRGLGITHATLGNNDQARKHYLRYLELAPKSPDAPQLRRMLGLH
jgi:pSer/pThr/pTyr-binding forkhead associated (FHA) protein/TolA-binding protein